MYTKAILLTEERLIDSKQYPENEIYRIESVINFMSHKSDTFLTQL